MESESDDGQKLAVDQPPLQMRGPRQGSQDMREVATHHDLGKGAPSGIPRPHGASGGGSARPTEQ